MTTLTIDDVLAEIERASRDAKQRRQESFEAAQEILSAAMSDGRSNLTADEERRFQTLRKQGRAAAEEA
jgi:hypothetical protein